MITLLKTIQDNNSLVDYIPSAQAADGGVGGFDIFSLLRQFISGEGAATVGVLGVLSLIWFIYAMLAYVVAIVFLVLYVYASINKQMYIDLQIQALRDEEAVYQKQFSGVRRSSRLNDVMVHADSDNPNDWKLAIIEADIVLDDTLKQKGYAGASLGERLKSVQPHQLNSLNDAWEAHKVRNRIAHDGADFVLTKRAAKETIDRYLRVFDEFGVR